MVDLVLLIKKIIKKNICGQIHNKIITYMSNCRFVQIIFVSDKMEKKSNLLLMIELLNNFFCLLDLCALAKTDKIYTKKKF